MIDIFHFGTQAAHFLGDSAGFFLEAGLRLFLALVFGGIIGWERERHNQPAGLRTHMLICMGSALLMLLSVALSLQFPDAQRADPGRIAAQVVSGIGFIGGGAILHLRGSVRGITTAASLWVVAGLGLSIGAGMYVISTLAVVLVFITLALITRVEAFAVKPFFERRLDIFVDTVKADSVQNVQEKVAGLLENDGLSSQVSELGLQLQDKRSRISYHIRMPQTQNTAAFCESLRKIQGVSQVRLSALK